MELGIKLASIFFSMILVDNYVLAKFLGICPFLGVSKKLDSAFGMSCAVIVVMAIATAVTFPINAYLLKPLKLEYLQTISFILIIAALVQFLEIALKKFIPSLHKSLGVYLPLITTNCAVLGVTIDNLQYVGDGSFLKAMIASLGVGLGFLLAMVLFAGVRSRIENCPAPKCFRGLPVTLIAAAIVAMAFMGLGGVVEALLA